MLLNSWLLVFYLVRSRACSVVPARIQGRAVLAYSHDYVCTAWRGIPDLGYPGTGQDTWSKAAGSSKAQANCLQRWLDSQATTTALALTSSYSHTSAFLLNRTYTSEKARINKCKNALHSPGSSISLLYCVSSYSHSHSLKNPCTWSTRTWYTLCCVKLHYHQLLGTRFRSSIICVWQWGGRSFHQQGFI